MSEDRGQMSEDRCQKSEVRRQMSEDRGQKSDVRGQKSEIRRQRLWKSACDELSRIEVGPVDVPNELDYAAASMRKSEKGIEKSECLKKDSDPLDGLPVLAFYPLTLHRTPCALSRCIMRAP
jgi:hypothetical protein